MPRDGSVPLSWRPRGLSDAVDGTNAFAGAMASLQNLVPDPATADVWVPRPAAVSLTTFTGTNAPAGPGFVSGLLVVGNLAYGMIASTRNAGKDEPFCYNLSTGAFLPISGITSANSPTSPATSGDWTPPILAQVGGRIIVCHPGFPGATVKFGWLDVSGLNTTTTGDTISGVPIVVGYPNTFGLQAGLTITGAGIPASTVLQAAVPVLTNATVIVGAVTAGSPVITVTANYGFAMAEGAPIYSNAFPAGTTSAQNGNVAGPISVSQNALVTGTIVAVFDVNSGSLGPLTNVGATHSNTVIDGITYGTSGMFVGQSVTGPSIPAGTTVASITGASSITISQAATATGTINFSVSGTYLLLSANATATANGVTLTIAGGTATAPLWGAGDTGLNPLPSTPVGVAQFNGRAYYACGTNGVVFSDSLLPCQVTSGSQALTTNDGVACTAIAPLMLSSLLSGGIVQALIVFQGSSRMRQITGDQATSNLSMNTLPVATGTLAPLSAQPCELGTAFVSPEGLRFVTFTGTVTPPIGDAGSGVAVPFIDASHPSRICLAAKADVIRVSVLNGAVAGSPAQEYWYDISRKVWYGPHTFPASLIQAWGNTFVMAPSGITAALWQSDPVPSSGSVYTENGSAMRWVYSPVALPDNGAMRMNAMTQSTFAAAFGATDVPLITASDIDGTLLDRTGLGAGAAATTFQQRTVPWTKPLVFKQLDLTITGLSNASVRLGNFYMRYEILGYTNLTVLPSGAPWLLDDLGNILYDDAGNPLLAV